MKENAIRKINKLGKVGVIVARIARILMIVGAVCILIATIALMIIPEDFMKINFKGNMGIEINISDFYDGEINVDEVNQAIKDGQIELEDGEEYVISDVSMEDGVLNVEAEAGNISYSLRSLAGSLFAGFLDMAALIVVMVFIEKLCIAFRECESPFEDKVLKSLNNFSISMIPWAVISTLSAEISALLTSGDVVLGGIDLTYVFILLVILGLTFVFKYGAMLQKESDETL